MKRPIHSSCSQSEPSQQSNFMHHWILIKLKNQKKYNIESLEDEYKISLVTNELITKGVKNLTVYVTEYNLTLELFYRMSFYGVGQYHSVTNNCIHFVQKILFIISYEKFKNLVEYSINIQNIIDNKINTKYHKINKDLEIIQLIEQNKRILFKFAEQQEQFNKQLKEIQEQDRIKHEGEIKKIEQHQQQQVQYLQQQMQQLQQQIQKKNKKGQCAQF